MGGHAIVRKTDERTQGAESEGTRVWVTVLPVAPQRRRTINRLHAELGCTEGKEGQQARDTQ